MPVVGGGPPKPQQQSRPLVIANRILVRLERCKASCKLRVFSRRVAQCICKGDQLLCPSIPLLEELFSAGPHEPLRTLQIILETGDEEVSRLIGHRPEIHAQRPVRTRHEHGLAGDAMDGVHDHIVAQVLIAINGGPELLPECHVPHADAIHGHISGLAAHPIFDIIAANEDGKRQPMRSHGRQGDAGIPPCSVCVLYFDIHHFIDSNIHQAIHEEIAFETLIDPISAHMGDIFKLLVRMLHLEHGSIDERIRIFVGYQGEKIEGADDTLGCDAHIVIHEQDVCEALICLKGRHHPPREARGAPLVGIRQDRDAVMG